jgi:TPR repeat protein
LTGIKYAKTYREPEAGDRAAYEARAEVFLKELPALLTAACSSKRPGGCLLLGRWYGDPHFGDAHVDVAKAATHLGEACTSDGGEACDRLGSLYCQGQGVKQDPRRANELFAQGGSTERCEP